MLQCFLEHINRRISRLHLIFTFNSVSLDQLTFKNKVIFVETRVIKKPKEKEVQDYILKQ